MRGVRLLAIISSCCSKCEVGTHFFLGGVLLQVILSSSSSPLVRGALQLLLFFLRCEEVETAQGGRSRTAHHQPAAYNQPLRSNGISVNCQKCSLFKLKMSKRIPALFLTGTIKLKASLPCTASGQSARRKRVSYVTLLMQLSPCLSSSQSKCLPGQR